MKLFHSLREFCDPSIFGCDEEIDLFFAEHGQRGKTLHRHRKLMEVRLDPVLHVTEVQEADLASAAPAPPDEGPRQNDNFPVYFAPEVRRDINILQTNPPKQGSLLQCPIASRENARSIAYDDTPANQPAPTRTPKMTIFLSK